MTTTAVEICVPAEAVPNKVGATRIPAPERKRGLLLLLAGIFTAIFALVSSGVVGAFIALETQDREEVAHVEVVHVEASLNAELKESNVNVTKIRELVADFEALAKQGHTSPFEAPVTATSNETDLARRLALTKQVYWDCDPWSYRVGALAATQCVWKKESDSKSSHVSRNDPFVKTMVKHKDTLNGFCPWLVRYHEQGRGWLAWWVASNSYGGALRPFIWDRGNTNLGNMCNWMPLLKKMHTVSYQYGSWEKAYQVTEATRLETTESLTVGFYESSSTSETTTSSVSVGAEISGPFAKVFSFGVSASASLEHSITRTAERGSSSSSTWTTTKSYKWLGPDSQTCKDGADPFQDVYQFVYNVVYADGRRDSFRTDHVSQLCHQCSTREGECPPRNHAPAAFQTARFPQNLGGQPLCHVPAFFNKALPASPDTFCADRKFHGQDGTPDEFKHLI